MGSSTPSHVIRLTLASSQPWAISSTSGRMPSGAVTRRGMSRAPIREVTLTTPRRRREARWRRRGACAPQARGTLYGGAGRCGAGWTGSRACAHHSRARRGTRRPARPGTAGCAAPVRRLSLGRRRTRPGGPVSADLDSWARLPRRRRRRRQHASAALPHPRRVSARERAAQNRWPKSASSLEVGWVEKTAMTYSAARSTYRNWP